MPRLKTDSLDLVADGKVINIKTPERRNEELNRALLDPGEFANFAADPQSFAKQYDLDIDKTISDQLAAKLKGVRSLDELEVITMRGGEGDTTVWAAVAGSFSVSTAKVAVAF
jgi:hypothetical protein